MGLIRSIQAVRAQFRAIESQVALTAPPPELPVAGARILIAYLFDGMGDALALGPALAALAARGPERIGVLTLPLAARALALLDLPIRVHVVSKAAITHAASNATKTPRAIRAERKLLDAELVDAGYDVAVDLTARAGLDAWSWLDVTRPSTRIGWVDADGQPAGLTWGTLDIRTRVDRHWTDCQTHVLRAFGVEAGDDVGWKLPKRAVEHAARLFGRRRRLLVVPGSRSADKRWSVEAFTAVAKAARPGSVVVTGAPNERALVRSVARQIAPTAKEYTGTSLATLAALVQRADAVLTNDTGPMHMAFLSGVPTLAVFTHMSPTAWGPRVADERFVTLVPRGDPMVDSASKTLHRLLRSFG